MNVHNHPPYMPVCNERRVNGQLRGACLTDEGDPVSDTKPDLDAIERDHRLFVHPDEGIDMCWQCRVEALALVAYARRLEAESEGLRALAVQWTDYLDVKDRAEAAEAERDLIGDTLARRSAAHDRLAQRLDQIRAAVLLLEPDDITPIGARKMRGVLDGDQQAEKP